MKIEEYDRAVRDLIEKQTQHPIYGTELPAKRIESDFEKKVVAAFETAYKEISHLKMGLAYSQTQKDLNKKSTYYDNTSYSGPAIGIFAQIEVGGTRGGGYDGEQSSTKYTNVGSHAAVAMAMDDFLINLFDDLSFSQAVRLKKLFFSCDHHQNEYYGDSTDYVNYCISFAELEAFYVGNGLKLL